MSLFFLKSSSSVTPSKAEHMPKALLSKNDRTNPLSNNICIYFSLPIKVYYNINYTIVSLIWMSNAADFVLVVLLLDMIRDPQINSLSSIFILRNLSFSSDGLQLSFDRCSKFSFWGIGVGICEAQINAFLNGLEILRLS